MKKRVREFKPGFLIVLGHFLIDPFFPKRWGVKKNFQRVIAIGKATDNLLWLKK